MVEIIEMMTGAMNQTISLHVPILPTFETPKRLGSTRRVVLIGGSLPFGLFIRQNWNDRNTNFKKNACRGVRSLVVFQEKTKALMESKLQVSDKGDLLDFSLDGGIATQGASFFLLKTAFNVIYFYHHTYRYIPFYSFRSLQ